MKHDNLNTSNATLVQPGSALNEYNGKVLFPDKMAQANEMFKKVGLPKKASTRPKEAA
ncbi:hypothetical protein KBK19_13700 [Microvirga sp. STR05]|uniref:Uncharacterized protein n=1 Tax=Hymenobacter duratus TaxID=2771356 RepID=A0ABR8JGX3_9BACT|nr:hypothetical protein [Hymenobacter duratus]MBD2716091.1 hypothetical protein [Hymenobacter duratus]MBR7951005.1 hypothetical protein [Microvirga sp. STR05]